MTIRYYDDSNHTAVPLVITEAMHVAACKVLINAAGLDGTPQAMLGAIVASAPSLPQIEQEPVAWMNHKRDMTYLNNYRKDDVPLYENPPDLMTKIADLKEQLEAHDLVSKMIDVWCNAHKSQIPWPKLIALTAIITNMPDEERDRLLCLDYPDFPVRIKELEEQVRVARQALLAVNSQCVEDWPMIRETLAILSNEDAPT